MAVRRFDVRTEPRRDVSTDTSFPLIPGFGTSDTGRVNEHIATVARWASQRAWSRAGAIAHVLGQGAPRRVLGQMTRVALLVAGASTIGVAVALMLWNDFGPGPLDVFIGAVRQRTGLPLTLAVWATVGGLILLAWGLGRRPGVGTLAAPLVVGPTMQATLSGLEQFDAPNGFGASVAVHLVAIGLAGVGSGALIVSGLGAGTGELLAAAASDRSGRPETRVRLAFEVTWVVLGVALGGPIGVGTVLVAFLIGPAVQHGYRWVDAVAERTRTTVALAAA